MGYSITREQLESSSPSTLSGGRNWTKGKVRLLSWEGRRLAVKDMSWAHPLFRHLLGSWMIHHEFSVLEDLKGIRGIPAAYARIDRWAFARDYVEGKPLRGHGVGEISDGTFRRLSRVVDQLHARGIAHGDLHHRNIILNGTDELYLIDFTTSVRRGARWNLLKKWVFRQYCRMDERAILKLKSRFLRGGLSRREQRVLEQDPILHRLGKWARRLILRRKPGSSATR